MQRTAGSNRSASPSVTTRSESKANPGNDSSHEVPSVVSASSMDRAYDILLIVRETSMLTLDLFVSHAISCILLMPFYYLSDIPVYAITSTCVLRDMFKLYSHINELWCTEGSKAYSASLVLPRVVRYQASSIIANFYGPTRAITLVWLMPPMIWLFQALKVNGYMDEAFFQIFSEPSKDHCPDPFPQESAENSQSTELHSSGTEGKSWYPALLWDLLIEFLRYMFLYVALYSCDSFLSRVMALVLACFVGSRLCPRPYAVDHAQSVREFMTREFNDTVDSDTITYPSFF